jgi:hypothetical protein
MSAGNRHYRNAHQASQPEKCQLCQHIFKNFNSLAAHMRSMHGVTQKMLKTNAFY